jgi:hypothetical protein
MVDGDLLVRLAEVDRERIGAMIVDEIADVLFTEIRDDDLSLGTNARARRQCVRDPA